MSHYRQPLHCTAILHDVEQYCMLQTKLCMALSHYRQPLLCNVVRCTLHYIARCTLHCNSMCSTNYRQPLFCTAFHSSHILRYATHYIGRYCLIMQRIILDDNIGRHWTMLYVANKLLHCTATQIMCNQCVRIVVGFFRVTLHYALYCTILHDIVRCTLYVVLQLKCVQPMCAYTYTYIVVGLRKRLVARDRRTFPNIDFDCLVTISSKNPSKILQNPS